MRRRLLPALVVVFAVGGLALFGAHLVSGPAHAAGSWHGMPGPGGMMGGWGGMMGGSFGNGTATQTSVTPAELASVRDRVEKRLAGSRFAGFRVAEVMAFTNNDYVLLDDTAGKPAFELLVDPDGRWLMPEPQSMMWNTSYGMPHWFGAAGTPVSSPAEAKKRADAWLALHRPGEVTADATTLPGYFTIDVTKAGAKVGMLSVDGRTGAVWFHTWHARFLADRDF